jgi:hypothetical protein
MSQYVEQSTAVLARRIADDCWRTGQHPDGLDLKTPGDGVRVRVIRTAVERAVDELGGQER